jgi:predicted nucleotide-binding protein (sugar kinase/HSP70/actin superfamily)
MSYRINSSFLKLKSDSVIHHTDGYTFSEYRKLCKKALKQNGWYDIALFDLNETDGKKLISRFEGWNKLANWIL